MAMPLSGNQLKRLTRRLRDNALTSGDLRDLLDVLIYYRQVLIRARADLAHLCAGVPHVELMAPRVKTLKTTIEKLHRQPQLYSLAQVRDMAGLRVVVLGTRGDQDVIAQSIAELFAGDQHPAKFIDRRVDPRAGYRAVHLEVRRDGILIEIQIRTSLQHRWAELFEGTADRLGRGLRYGESVLAAPDVDGDAYKLVELLSALSGMIDQVERHPIEDPFRRVQGRAVHELLAYATALLAQL